MFMQNSTAMGKLLNSEDNVSVSIPYENLSMQYTEVSFKKRKLKIPLENSDFIKYFAQKIHRRGGSNQYTQCMFWIRSKKSMYTRLYPSLTISKWGFRGYTFHGHVFLINVSVSIFEIGVRL